MRAQIRQADPSDITHADLGPSDVAYKGALANGGIGL